MKIPVAKFLVFTLAFSLAIPESFAKRMGSGRSAGRQSQMASPRSRSSLPPRMPPSAASRPTPVPPSSNPAAAPVQRTQPDVARQSVPPIAPQLPPVRQSSPWGGMIGGALLGLGLGSILSHGNERGTNNTNSANTNQAENGSGTGAETSGGNGPAGNEAGTGTDTAANVTAQQTAPAQRTGFPWLLALLGIGAIFFVLRRRRHNRHV